MENGDQILPFVRCFYGRTSGRMKLETPRRSHREREGARRPPHAIVVFLGSAPLGGRPEGQ